MERFENVIDSEIVIGNEVVVEQVLSSEPINAVKVPMPIELQDKVVEPRIAEQVITADKGFDGLGVVTVSAVTSEIDSNIQPENIRDGVSVIGVVGTYIGDEKLFEKGFNLAYAKQLDTIEQIMSGSVLVERDYNDKEMQKLEATLVSLTQGE